MINLQPNFQISHLRHLLIVGGAFLCLFGTAELFAAPVGTALSEDIRDIMVNSPPPSMKPFIMGGMILIILLIGIWLFARLAISTKSIDNGPPADYLALQKLNKISQNAESISPNRASLEVSNAVKDFLLLRFQDPIRYETAEEFFSRISSNEGDEFNISSGLSKQVQIFLNTSQELKFAQLKEGKAQIPVLIDQAEAIVKAAKKEPKLNF